MDLFGKASNLVTSVKAFPHEANMIVTIWNELCPLFDTNQLSPDFPRTMVEMFPESSVREFVKVQRDSIQRFVVEIGVVMRIINMKMMKDNAADDVHTHDMTFIHIERACQDVRTSLDPYKVVLDRIEHLLKQKSDGSGTLASVFAC